MNERTGSYPCCPHCEDAKDDHVEFGGTVEQDGHDLPCTMCEYEFLTLPLLARAWDEGAICRANARPEVSVRDLNPYRRGVA